MQAEPQAQHGLLWPCLRVLGAGPANPGRAAAMAASLRAIKEEGAAATSAVKGVQAPSPVGVSAPPATQAPEAEAGAQVCALVCVCECVCVRVRVNDCRRRTNVCICVC